MSKLNWSRDLRQRRLRKNPADSHRDRLGRPVDEVPLSTANPSSVISRAGRPSTTVEWIEASNVAQEFLRRFQELPFGSQLRATTQREDDRVVRIRRRVGMHLFSCSNLDPESLKILVEAGFEAVSTKTVVAEWDTKSVRESPQRPLEILQLLFSEDEIPKLVLWQKNHRGWVPFSQ